MISNLELEIFNIILGDIYSGQKELQENINHFLKTKRQDINDLIEDLTQTSDIEEQKLLEAIIDIKKQDYNFAINLINDLLYQPREISFEYVSDSYNDNSFSATISLHELGYEIGRIETCLHKQAVHGNISPRCREDYSSILKTNPTVAPMIVMTSFLISSRRRMNIAPTMYLNLSKFIKQTFNAALFAGKCDNYGETSYAARRVYESIITMHLPDFITTERMIYYKY